jgi:precorrin-2 dehydrogenase/sirohydrochlorin ferrochelatase
MLLDVSDRPILIVGGGNVAARKAEGLLAAGATNVHAVSPTFCGRMPLGVGRIAARYDVAQLVGMGLVFAATNLPDVNAQVVKDCRKRGILVSRADEGDGGDFSSMAVYRDVAVTIGISACGSPAVAARLRDSIAQRLDRDLVMLADAARQLRPCFPPGDDRRELMRRLASDDAIAVLKDGGIDALADWLKVARP